MSPNRDDLKNYYKKVLVCKLCRKEYGVDEKTDSGICPVCEVKLYQKNKDDKKRIFLR